MLKLPEIGSHAAYQQFFPQIIGNKHLKKKETQTRSNSPSPRPFTS